MPDFSPVQSRHIEALTRIVGRDAILHGDPKPLHKYSHDQLSDPRYAHAPDVVVLPRTTEQVAATMRLAHEQRIPVTPRAAGSGLSGGAVPIHGGICLCCERMDRILEIDTNNLMVVVEPGVVTRELDVALRGHQLFFAGYPMSEEFCMIGGNVGENAGGGRAIKYGVVSRYITGLELVTPQGKVVTLGGKRVKDVTGYDLVSLLCGSEGTLGYITRVFIKLLPLPRHRQSTLALFPDVDSAIAVVPAIMSGGGFLPTSVEFMDRTSTVAACRAVKETIDYERAGAMMLFEVDGSSATEVAAHAAFIHDTCAARGASPVLAADTPEAIDRFWKIRKRVPWAIKRMSAKQSMEDIVVPISAIPALVSALPPLEERHGVAIPVFGHAGDGNLHAVPMPRPGTEQNWDDVLPRVLSDLYELAADLGGTISGEHGIGHKRKYYLRKLADPTFLELMQGIKNAWDPHGIMNPGKIL